MLRVLQHGSAEYYAAVKLRDRVLRRPLGLTFSDADLEAERDDVLLGDFDLEGNPVATLQFRPKGETWQMRQVAVESDLQGAGRGRRLVHFAEDWARRAGIQRIFLHAREVAVPFYLKVGYSISGDRFEEVGIAHLPMAKDLTAAKGYLRFVEAHPNDLQGTVSRRPLAIVPWGALEWHGHHLPAGLDGLVAEAFCARLAERTGGVLFPTTYLPITTLPHASSIDVKATTFRLVLRDLLESIARAGFRAVLLVSGHYAQAHEWELYEAAESACRTGLACLAAAPLEVLEEDELLDHAGYWEASCLSLFRPDLARLESVPEPIVPTRDCILGPSPKDADPVRGWEAMDRAWTRWHGYASQLLAGETGDVFSFCERRRNAYEGFRRTFYRENWEQAAADWWQSMRDRDAPPPAK